MSQTARRLLLISNSTTYGRDFLDHVEPDLKEMFGTTRRILFIPYALYDRAAYTAKARARLAAMGYPLDSIHEAPCPARAVEGAEALFVGGGNTFRLLKALYEAEVLDPIRRRVAQGIPFVGSSAGSIVAGPSLKTTKDMPIVQPPSFEALGLVRFQISPHYLDPDPHSTHMGETQEERILQFLEENDAPVVGLREGSWLVVEENSTRLKGRTGARVFRRGFDPVEVQPGATLDPYIHLTGLS